MSKEREYAIIEIGSNTMRLVIYKQSRNGKLDKIENRRVRTRLHNHLSKSGRFEDTGVNKLLQTLKDFQQRLHSFQLAEMTCIATGTLRSAKNQQSVLNIVKKHTGITIRILSGYDEIYYGYIAVTNSMPYINGFIIDVGGGSTEVSYFENKRLISYHSFSFGALSLRQQFVKGHKPEEDELRTIRMFVCDQLSSLSWRVKHNIPVIGIGGNAHNVVRIHKKKRGRNSKNLHQCKITYSDIQEVSTYLQTMNFSKLQKVDGLDKNRADIILPALCIFQGLMRKMPTNQFILSRKGVRDGLLYQLIK